ncbi:MAG: hypothetical protein OXR73_25195 [Myxococcales bacterium]|nr:hypothetical protein [Myxococcales bacterium]
MLGSTETLRRGFELLSEFEQLFCDQPAYELIEYEEHFAVRSVGLVHPSASAMRSEAVPCAHCADKRLGHVESTLMRRFR